MGLCLIIALATADTGLAEPVTVTVTGVGFISDGDIAAARDDAIRDARIRALEQAMGVEVDARTALHKSLLIDDTVITRTRGAVRSFTILSEGLEAFGLYRVTLQAVVDGSILGDELMRAAGNKRVLFLWSEKNTTGNEPLLERLAAAFAGAGFGITRAKLPEIALQTMDGGKIRTVSQQADADLAAVLQLVSGPARCYTDNYCAAASSGSIRLYAAKTGKLIAKAEKRGIGGYGNNANQASANARDRCAEVLVGDLMRRLLVPQEKELKIAVRGIPDFDTYRSLKRHLGILRWVKQIREDAVGYHPVKSVFWITFAQDPDLLGGMLDKLGGYRFTGRTGAVLTLEAEKNRRSMQMERLNPK